MYVLLFAPIESRLAPSNATESFSSDMGRIIAAGLPDVCDVEGRILPASDGLIKGHAHTDLSLAPLLDYSQLLDYSMNNHDQGVCSQLDDSHHVVRAPPPCRMMSASLLVGVAFDRLGTRLIRITRLRIICATVKTLYLDPSVTPWAHSFRPGDYPSKLPNLVNNCLDLLQLARSSPTLLSAVSDTETDMTPEVWISSLPEEIQRSQQ
ncbi:hypothetical protein J6590_088024 [Homalodisca vitripennis]|nr:hypothetical protein J6590_088024 [Homalodisca vitripennis]